MSINYGNYKSVGTASMDNRQLMILVLKKVKSLMEQAQGHLIEKDFVNLPKKILKVKEIFKVLTTTIPVKKEIPGSKEVFDMYQNMIYLTENLIAKKAEAKEYDYFINYFDGLISELETGFERATEDILPIKKVEDPTNLQENTEYKKVEFVT